jgi:signal transduction histidine kinase
MSLNVSGGNAVIGVKDTGIGVSIEELPMLFNAFYQAERSMSRPDSGLGLGLAIVKAIAELHGGQVSVQSKGLGTGATFTVTLPFQSDTPGDTSSDLLKEP